MLRFILILTIIIYIVFLASDFHISDLNKKEKCATISIMLSALAVVLVICAVHSYAVKNKKYKEGIHYIEINSFGFASDRFEKLGNFKDSEVLYAYSMAKREMKEMEYYMKFAKGEKYVRSYLELIPDDYSGIFCEEIANDKIYVYSGEFRVVCEKNTAERDAEEIRKLNERKEEAKPASSGKKNSKYIYIPPTKTTPYYTDPDDYDNPEDFADDAWGLDFDDWDDAYDYWEDY